MKVLILHQFYNTPSSGGAIRSYYLARALAESGISPIVLTTHNQREIRKIKEDGIEVHYLPVTYNNRYGFIKRVFSFLTFVWNTVKYAGQFRDTDICYAISTPLTTGIGAMWIKFRYKIPYYFEVGDLWPEAPIQMGFIKNPLLKIILHKLEKSIYVRAIAVVALSPSIEKSIKTKVPKKKVRVIPNMADTDYYMPQPKPQPLEEKYDVKEKFVVAYLGTLGLANGLEYIISCAEMSEKAALPIRFIICGEGAVDEQLKQSAEEKSLTNLVFIPFQNREGVKEIMSITDGIMVCFKNLPVLETGSPNKFFDGLAAGKLIILNFGGWLKEELMQYECGISLTPTEPHDFVDRISPFIRDQQLLRRYQQNARRLAEEKYSRKLLSESFVELFNGDAISKTAGR